MARNTLKDLNNHLFEQMERLNDDSLKGSALEEEMERARAMTGVAKQIIDNGTLVLNAQKFNDDRLDISKQTPEMLEG
ncbi:hypothetical protein [Paenilisteria newyorkensis]|uniref:hypothetical protein n=1 Tax=Listeria newyorkensis TaxID=1497681 RepID=UPI000669D33B|nr:hypothetical protein [Listeria newyorkensis]KMT62678.1 hypothetical protein X559_0961 [Listeria newyorkensis]